MIKTIFITGASSGIGKATALYFQSQGWQVIATMRDPKKEQEFAALPHVLCVPLDVTSISSIQNACARAIKKFGTIDVLVNNAGYGMEGPFESVSPEDVQKIFATNVTGLMEMTRALLPQFRKQNSGTIINISSMGGRVTFPFYSLYHSTKWAVEGFSEALSYELSPFHIRVKMIEPGIIHTNFYTRMEQAPGKAISAYGHHIDHVRGQKQTVRKFGIAPIRVAEKIFEAATDTGNRLRYPVGLDAHTLLFLRKILPDEWFVKLVLWRGSRKSPH